LFDFEIAFQSSSNRKYRLFNQGKNSFYQSFCKTGLMMIKAEKLFTVGILLVLLSFDLC